MTSTQLSVRELAIDGGLPVRTQPFAPWPSFTADEIAVVSSVLGTGHVNYWSGVQGRCFEEEFADSVGTKYAVAVSNGSVALELALHSIGIQPGDEVVVPSRTFIASASSVIMRGAVPVFADVDRESQTITAQAITSVLSKRTRAIIVVHLAGWPSDMDAILEVAYKNGLMVIEDCAQAQGAMYKGRHVGSIGHVATFSFCHDKIMSTAGEGGMLTTNDKSIWERAWSFKDHGKDYEAAHRQGPSSTFRWVHRSFGTNWRMTEIQSAIGRVLLRKVPERIRERQHLASLLNTGLSQVSGLRLTVPPSHVSHASYKYYSFLRPEHLREGWSQSRVVDAINTEGVPCFTGSCSEIYLEEAFRDLRPVHRLPTAQELGETSLMFLVHPTLSDQDMEDTCAAVRKVMKHASTS